VLTCPQKLESLGTPCRGDKQIQAKNTRVYVRFTNIRDACMLQRHVQLGGTDWAATSLSPPEFVQVSLACALKTHGRR